jgi:activator of HSP90 ATPase
MKQIKTGTIKQQVFIDAKPVDVYNAYIGPKKQTEFTGYKASGGAKKGQAINYSSGYISGKTMMLVKGKRIVQLWKTTKWPEGYPYSMLDLRFKKKGNGTVLSMIHSKVPKSQISDYKGGWMDFYWKPLQKYFKKIKI